MLNKPYRDLTYVLYNSIEKLFVHVDMNISDTSSTYLDLAIAALGRRSIACRANRAAVSVETSNDFFTVYDWKQEFFYEGRES